MNLDVGCFERRYADYYFRLKLLYQFDSFTVFAIILKIGILKMFNLSYGYFYYIFIKYQYT